MLKINGLLGFKPYMAQSIWQVETARVAAYLDAPSAEAKEVVPMHAA